MKVFIFVLLTAYACATQSPEEGNMVEGDMELDPDQMAAFAEQMSKIGASSNSFASIKAGLWLTNGKADTIKYYIDPQISGATSAISQAIADYHLKTCIRFKRYSSRPSGPHIFFTTGSGCSSPVGRGSRGNSIRLARGCWRKGTIIHEIGHSIGLFHEQSRPDRDNFVTILLQNVRSSSRHNFNKLTTSRIDSRGTAYDYDSIMHYGSKYFSTNGQYTIQTKNSKDQRRIGNRSGFSETDIVQINKMYCQGTTKPVTNPPSNCKDNDTRCSGWKRYCLSNSYVKKNCLKSCGTC